MVSSTRWHDFTLLVTEKQIEFAVAAELGAYRIARAVEDLSPFIQQPVLLPWT
jgi:hypothetical protein